MVRKNTLSRRGRWIEPTAARRPFRVLNGVLMVLLALLFFIPFYLVAMASLTDEVEIAAKGHEPHRVAFYLYELASDFHGLWNKGNEDESLRFIQGDSAISAAKIALARAVGVVICAGLGILGVTPVEEMR